MGNIKGCKKLIDVEKKAEQLGFGKDQGYVFAGNLPDYKGCFIYHRSNSRELKLVKKYPSNQKAYNAMCKPGWHPAEDLMASLKKGRGKCAGFFSESEWLKYTGNENLYIVKRAENKLYTAKGLFQLIHEEVSPIELWESWKNLTDQFLSEVRIKFDTRNIKLK
jgi:hypothetical protein